MKQFLLDNHITILATLLLTKVLVFDVYYKYFKTNDVMNIDLMEPYLFITKVKSLKENK